ncbi:peptidase [Brevundimonas faecalis]|uniref:Peptidase n=1 Tax=Brevundimonas faecalis TaxID=947378 RepID=A0ABV2RDQ1_9CAUL
MRALMTTSVLAASLLLAGAASAQSSIRPGQTVQGNFTSKDARMDDGSHYRCYTMQTNADEAYTVTLSSSDFDTYLSAGPGADCDDTTVSNDDGPDMGTDSQVRFMSNGGLWVIKANTLSEGETGRYQLRVSSGERVRPTTQVLPISIGESRQGRLEFSDRRADDGSYYDCYSLQIARSGSTAIRLDSGDFDAYLALYQGPQCDGDSISSDDDSGGGTSAQIVETLRPGTYSIRANTLGSDETGDYTLTVTSRR